jgi:hypothetical protein
VVQIMKGALALLCELEEDDEPDPDEPQARPARSRRAARVRDERHGAARARPACSGGAVCARSRTRGRVSSCGRCRRTRWARLSLTRSL